jgi:methyl-accepting chemotaxis protein
MSNHNLQTSEIRLLLDKSRQEIYKRSDRLIEIFLMGYFLFGLIIASIYDTWIIAMSVGGILLTVYFVSKKLFRGSTVNHYVASTVVGIFMAQFIYQTHGMFEMHFFAFIGATLLITYQDWTVQIPLAIVIVLHHAIFGYLQYDTFASNGSEAIYFTQLDYMDLQTFIIHCFLAVVILTICCLWAIDMSKRTEENTRNILIVEELTANFSRNLEFANMLVNGDFDQHIQTDSNDPFASVLVDLQNKLKAANARG